MNRKPSIRLYFFFNDTATTEIYTLSLHDALPIYLVSHNADQVAEICSKGSGQFSGTRSEEHTSELQSRLHLVCRLLLEKKKKNNHGDLGKDFTNSAKAVPE